MVRRRLVLDENGKPRLIDEDDTFELIKASKLSLDDDFMKHELNTSWERKFKDELEDVIKRGIKDFWRPKYDPSFNEDKTGICYEPGKMPAVGKNYNWWEEIAKKFDPTRKSRLGTKSEYVAFLGCFIKNLVESGWEVAKAWDTVCNDSKELGHYRNSKDAKGNFEPTGSREILGFYDLANTRKILAEDEEAGGFWLAGGNFLNSSDFNPLADLYHYGCRNYDCDNSVGWLVLER